MSRIVVGVDGSPNSVAALRWAAAEAQLRGGHIVAVHAWEFPYAGPLAGLPTFLPPDELVAAATEVLDAAITEALGEDLPVKVDKRVIAGVPAAVLLEESRGADLLVVGERGHGGFVGLLLGSVSNQVVAHADVPTVVVPGPHRKQSHAEEQPS